MKNKALRSLVVMMIAVMVVAMMPVSVSAASKKPGRVKISSVTAGKVSKADNTYTMTIKWKKVKNATGYVIYAKHGTGGWVKQKKVGKNIRKFKLTKVPAGQTQIKIKAVNKKKPREVLKGKNEIRKEPNDAPAVCRSCGAVREIYNIRWASSIFCRKLDEGRC